MRIIVTTDSRSPKHNVASLVRGVVNRGKDIFPLQGGIIAQDLIKGGAGLEKLKYISHTDALAANTGTASALASSTVIRLRRSCDNRSCVFGARGASN